MRLSDVKYIKVINGEEAFIPEDADRFYAKKIQHLYITNLDAEQYFKSFEENISMVMNSEASEAEITVITLESLESVQKFASVLGWTPEVVNAAKHAVNLAVKAVSIEPNILKLVKQKLSDPGSKYSTHVGILALVSCGFCHQLGWVSDSTQMKLGLAALMHDIAIDEKKYDEIFKWNEAAADNADKKAETVKYRSHPLDAALLLQSMKNVPPDVDKIILQHHEKNDGSGFPRGLSLGRISPMASVFIIVEDLVTFLDETPDFGENIHLFIKLRAARYSSGNFKKVFDVFKETVDKTRQRC
jgi:response regulator RpfG family c-di-GMP phosphodiesterase